VQHIALFRGNQLGNQLSLETNLEISRLETSASALALPFLWTEEIQDAMRRPRIFLPLWTPKTPGAIASKC
jgi:hypothetical protein